MPKEPHMNNMKILPVILSIVLIVSVSQAFQTGAPQETPKLPLPSEERPVQAVNAQTPIDIPQDSTLPISAPPKDPTSSSPGSSGAGPYVAGNGIQAPAVLLQTRIPNTEQAQTVQEAEFEMVVPEGTVIPIVLTAFLNTQSSQVGDTLYADTTYPIWIQQRLVIPKGSTIRGTVTEVIRPGKIKGKGHLAIRIDDILLPNGVKRELVAGFRGIHGPGDESLNRKSETVSSGSSKGADVGTVVGTSATGAIIGAIAEDHGTGAAIGAAAGAAVGLATVLFTRGHDLVLNPGTQFDLELKKPLKFAYNELDFTGYQLNSAQRDARPRPVNPNTRNTGRRTLPLPGFGFPFPRIF
jgi:hypothetical protein